jgi:hypothetical protein
MRCYSLLLGARNARRSFSKADDAQVRAITLRHFPTGFTILNCAGAGYDPARRRFIMEQSRQILVCTSSTRRLRQWAGELAKALNQRELLVVEMGRGFVVRPG